VPSKIEQFKDLYEYNFQCKKVGRGNRLIILAIGGKEGMLVKANEVYEITKDATDDYHKLSLQNTFK
jgi:hypothetical protein